MPVLGGGCLGFDQGNDLLQVGDCLMCAHLLRVLDWLVEVEVHLGVSPKGGEDGGYLRSFGCGVVDRKLA